MFWVISFGKHFNLGGVMKNKKLVISLAIIGGLFILIILDIYVFRHFKGRTIMVELILWPLFVAGIIEWVITKNFFPKDKNSCNKEN
jgi:hypothetical protein